MMMIMMMMMMMMMMMTMKVPSFGTQRDISQHGTGKAHWS